MDHLREGGSTTRPPLLGGTNYSHWKAKMRAFIKSMDEQAWRTVVIGWEHPAMINEQKEEVLKTEDQWNTEEEKIMNYNSKALNAIFSAVDVNQFKLIATYESAKKAWTTLQIPYEGTATMRMSKLQILYSDCKLVRKALSSLPKKFAYKVTTIEEARDIEKMKLDELMGSLQIFELNLNHNRIDKEKSVAFQAKFPKSSTSTSEDNDDRSESLALVTKKFGKFLRMMDENSNKPKSGKSFNSQKDKTNFNSFDDRKNKRIQFHECEGFGHIQAECVNTLKWMGNQENDHTLFSSKMMNNHHEHVATNQRYVPTIQYNATYLTSSAATCEKDVEISDSEINKIIQFTNLVAEKDRKIHKTEQELLYTQKMMKLDSDKKKLDEILFIGKPCSHHHELGYIGESSTSKTIFVKEQKRVESIFDKSKKTIFQKPKPKRFISICHFYNLLGHIRPRCFRFKKALRNGMHFGSPASAILQQKSKLKSYLKCFVADISLKSCTDDSWYFDSGCSKHMTGDKEKLKGYQSVNEGHVIFEDGEKGRVLGKGVLNVEGLPKLKNVLYVESLKANLISISQLFYQNLLVRFNKNKCQVFNETNRCMLTGSRSSDKCYMLVQKNHLTDQIIDSLTEGMRTRDKPTISYKNMVRNVCFTSLIKPKNEREKIVEQLKGLEGPYFSIHIFCDNSSVIDIFKTPVQH
ncbi:hypothetical protein Pfo_018219 [Paulownia fortunei]|nr:hypothetical protein Pfo_018219 [Paulownia fortunei]